MYTYIREIMIELVELLVFTGLILNILPGEQYQKYVKLLLGIVLIAFVMDAGGKVEKGTWIKKIDFTEISNEKLNFEMRVNENIEESQYSRALSTSENKIKTIINKLYPNDEIVAKSVKISICEDVDNVDYGKITAVKVEVSKNVDKSGNILVNHIIIGKIDKKSDDSEYAALQIKIAEALGLDVEVVQVVLS